jgi:hypothetical protein
VVPGLYDVHVVGTDGSQAVVSEGIRPLYRQYVEAGYQPGVAAVYRGHYHLPVLDGTTVIDTLVCRLDRGSAWTRWDDHAATIAYATEVGEAEREPRLIGVSGTRFLDLSGCHDPGPANDADSTAHVATVVTRDMDLVGSSRRPGTVERVELDYEVDAGSATVEWAAGEEGSAFTALTTVRGGAASDGSEVSVWALNKARRSIRLRVVLAGAGAVLRRVSVRVRRSGR